MKKKTSILDHETTRDPGWKFKQHLWNHHLYSRGLIFFSAKVRPTRRIPDVVNMMSTWQEKKVFFFLAPKKMLLWLVSNMTTTHTQTTHDYPARFQRKLKLCGHFGKLFAKIPSFPNDFEANKSVFFSEWQRNGHTVCHLEFCTGISKLMITQPGVIHGSPRYCNCKNDSNTPLCSEKRNLHFEPLKYSAPKKYRSNFNIILFLVF